MRILSTTSSTLRPTFTSPHSASCHQRLHASGKENQFLNLYQLQLLLKHLHLGSQVSWDWFILLIAKTGLRYAEALALTPADIDVENQIIV